LEDPIYVKGVEYNKVLIYEDNFVTLTPINLVQLIIKKFKCDLKKYRDEMKKKKEEKEEKLKKQELSKRT
jgi:ribosomal protein L14E/L6E/L27E